MSEQSSGNGTGWTPDQPMVSIKDVHKSFGDLEVLKGVSLDVMKGECICIIGPSGSGKSTLIRCVNALNDIQKGSITVEGIEVNDPNLNKLELRKKVGMVFQQYNLFPHKTAIQNVMMAPIHVLKQDKAEVEARARCSTSVLSCLSTWIGAIMTFSSAVLCGNKLYCWNTMPTFLRSSSLSSLGSLTSMPSTLMEPCWMSLSALTQRIRVDLPEPEGPMMQMHSPFMMSMETPFRTSKSPNDLCTSWIETIG